MSAIRIPLNRVVVGGSDSMVTDPPNRAAPSGRLAAAVRSPGLTWTLSLLPHVVALAITAVAIAGHHHRTGNLGDFIAAADAMRHGADLYASGTGGYVYPPLIAFLYQPLTHLSLPTAGLVVLAIDGALSVLTLVVVSRVLVYRLLDRTDPLLVARVALLGAALSFDKIKGEFGHLETNVLMLLAFTAALRWVDRRPWAAGLALGFAFNVKYLPLVLVPYLLLRRRWAATGWFAAWAAALAVLPAASMGWAGDATAWAEASGGLATLFGRHAVAAGAHVHAAASLVSISLTSGLARALPLLPPGPLLVAALIGAVACALAALAYVRRGVPLVRWPAVADQATPPFRGLFTVEWMAALLLMLTFGPFTNSRHLYMLLDVNIAAAALLLGGRGRVDRRPLAVAVAVLWLGVNFPPGGTRPFDRPDQFWRTVGGPGWCMLGTFAALIWTNLRIQVGPRPAPVRDSPVVLAVAVAQAV